MQLLFVVLSADGFELSVTDSNIIVSLHLLPTNVTLNNVKLQHNRQIPYSQASTIDIQLNDRHTVTAS
jgi:hypothetical protein